MPTLSMPKGTMALEIIFKLLLTTFGSDHPAARITTPTRQLTRGTFSICFSSARFSGFSPF